MSATLGPGSRVYIGYPSLSEQAQNWQLAACRCGTVLTGPHMPGSIVGSWRLLNSVHWEVCVDEHNGLFLVAEHLLTPLDGGEPERVETEDEAVA